MSDDNRPVRRLERPGPDDELLRRSFRLSGHATSVSMERAFWHALEACAAEDGLRPVDLVARVDETREGPLSRALRVYLLKRAAAGDRGGEGGPLSA